MTKNNRNSNSEAGLRVDVRHGNVDQALRRLKKKIANDGLLQELRDRQQFTTKTEKRLKAMSSAKARRRKELSQDNAVNKKRLY